MLRQTERKPGNSPLGLQCKNVKIFFSKSCRRCVFRRRRQDTPSPTFAEAAIRAPGRIRSVRRLRWDARGRTDRLRGHQRVPNDSKREASRLDRSVSSCNVRMSQPEKSDDAGSAEDPQNAGDVVAVS